MRSYRSSTRASAPSSPGAARRISLSRFAAAWQAPCGQYSLGLPRRTCCSIAAPQCLQARVVVAAEVVMLSGVAAVLAGTPVSGGFVTRDSLPISVFLETENQKQRFVAQTGEPNSFGDG
ncbi:hypothetical protein Mth01_08580 [Sphaerimonospora thailandensis]|uniref:Uncharacterized protein n=1 Tax=Sphaerimonospora thailandensis TaxID=795644 RepID=A0A8J3R533_9ACTN|nr:hypothetical protein Mth01_08580 [Sphaerimonospora thailandensis]